jgi:predicted transport protein
MLLFYNGKQFVEYEFQKEADFEMEIAAYSKLFFGRDSIFIDAKKKIETKSLGNSIPDGFLFDLSDKDNPEFYLVEVELSKHDFFNHIFPQITKFFGFFKNTTNQSDLVEKMFAVITNDGELKKEFKRHLGDREIYKFLKDTIENSQNILLILDGDKSELPEITETYSDTWGKMVKQLIIKKYTNSVDTIFTMNPDFESIEYVDVEDESKKESEKKEYSEEYHLDGISEVIKKVYVQLKDELLVYDSSLFFNPQKYYISIIKDRNLAFFKIRKKKITLVVMLPEDDVRDMISHHSIKHLSDPVQRFYNGPCCAIIIEDDLYLSEISNVLKKIISKNST